GHEEDAEPAHGVPRQGRAPVEGIRSSGRAQGTVRAKPRAAAAVISYSFNRLSRIIVVRNPPRGPLEDQPMQRYKLLTAGALLALGLVPFAADATPQQAKDQHGDSLPEGAIARLGTGRWRHGANAGFVTFLPGGKEVLSVGDDRTVRVWEYPSGKEIRHFGQDATDEPAMPGQRIVFYRGNGLPVAVSKDGKTVACDFDGSGLRLYEVATGKELPALQQGN